MLADDPKTQGSSASMSTCTDNNVFGEEKFGTHYVVLAHELSLDHRPPIVTDPQHSGFRWMTLAELISSPDVHQNTRAYFL
jgi:colanic acid biosynthesis protein WcaH